MPSFVTRVPLSREATPADDTTSLHEQWRVSWTLEQNGRSDEQTMAHATEVAARRHAGNLVKRRAPGMAIEDVYANPTVARVTPDSGDFDPQLSRTPIASFATTVSTADEDDG